MASVMNSLSRVQAIFIKETVQMRRDRLTFAMMFGIPIIQLILFGFAINSDPRHLPTAVVVEDQSPMVRTVLKGMENSDYFRFVLRTDDPRESGTLLAEGKVSFVVTIPARFTHDLLRGERPELLIEADASDPAAASNAIGKASRIIETALRHDLRGAAAPAIQAPSLVDLVIHPAYNPEGKTSYNIVPGLLGVILTMTLVMITGMAMTREVERGTMENLLAMPALPVEVMIGKILPYVVIGATQTVVILLAARLLFGVPFVGPGIVLVAGVAIFVVANLALGFTFSTIAQSQMQAMQLTFFFFLPSILLSGFMFPFRGMPEWAQTIGTALPLTHFLRLVRGVMLKGAGFSELAGSFLGIGIFTAVVMTVAMLRYRRTLD